MSKNEGEFVITGRHVLFATLAFFATLIAVQAAFVAVAISTHTGVVSQQPYRKGLNYSDRIRAEALQNKLGWKERLEFDDVSRGLTLKIEGPDGKAVKSLKVVATLSRPATTREDSQMELAPDWENDSYTAVLPESMEGAYIVDLEADDKNAGDGIIWRMRERLWIKP